MARVSESFLTFWNHSQVKEAQDRKGTQKFELERIDFMGDGADGKLLRIE